MQILEIGLFWTYFKQFLFPGNKNCYNYFKFGLMEKSRVIDILKTFSKEEIKSFKDFVNSPFFNRNKSVIRLFDIVRKSSPGFNSAVIRKENIYKKIFPGKTYNDIVMRILISDLLKLAEEFLAYSRYIKTPIIEKKLLLEELKERNLDRLHNKHIKLAEEILERSGITNHFYFLELYNLENHSIDFMISRDKQSLTASNVLKQGEYILFFSLIGILNIAHELLTQEDVLNISFEVNLVNEYLKSFNLDEFMGYLRKSNHEYYSVAAIYYYMYKAYKDCENDEYYFRLRNLVEDNLHRFDREEKFNLLIILESICVNKLGAGKSEFYKHLMYIYEFMIKEDLLSHTEKEYIQTNLFRNIFYTAVVLKQYQWAEKFIEKYSPRINPEQKDNLFCYSRAMLLFEKKLYGESLENISKVNQKFFPFKFDAKVLTLKIYFELEDFEPALSLIDSFAHFLSNNKSVHANDKERFGNFLKYLKLLIKQKTGFTEIHGELLVKEISLKTNVISKNWLIEKAGRIP